MLDNLKYAEPDQPEYKIIYQAFRTEQQEWIREQKKRIAVCALMSEGGYYLLSGDEFGDHTPRNVFTLPNGKCVYDELHKFMKEINTDLSHFIANLNNRIEQMPSATFPNWSKVINLPGQPDLLTTISYNGSGYNDQQPFLTVVNLSNEPKVLSQELIQKIAFEHQAQQNGEQNAYDRVMSTPNKATINPHASTDLYQRMKEHQKELKEENMRQLSELGVDRKTESATIDFGRGSK